MSGLATPAAGQVLVSGTNPAWSASPTLTGLTLSGISQHYLVYAGAGGALTGLSTPAAGQVLISGTDPAWSASPSLTTSLTVPTIYGGTTSSSTLVLRASSGTQGSNNIIKIHPDGAGRVTIFTATPLAWFTVDVNDSSNVCAIFRNQSASGAALQAITYSNSNTANNFVCKSNSGSRWDFWVTGAGNIMAGIGGSNYTEKLTLGNNNFLAGEVSAQTSAKKLIGLNTSNKVSLDKSGQTIVAGSSDIAWSNATGNLLATALDGLYLSGANGQRTDVLQAAATVNASNGASSVNAANLIPAGCLCIGVTTRVLTAFGATGGLTSISIGTGGSTTRWGNATGITLGTTTNLMNCSDTSPSYFTAATNVVITANGGTFDATGQIRVTVHYVSLTPATS